MTVVSGAVYAGCYVCGGVECTGCSPPTVDMCEQATHSAEDGEPGRTMLLNPPHQYYCYTWNEVDASDVVDAPCDWVSPYHILIGECGSQDGNCCFLDSVEFGEWDSRTSQGSTPGCGGTSCTGGPA